MTCVPGACGRRPDHVVDLFVVLAVEARVVDRMPAHGDERVLVVGEGEAVREAVREVDALEPAGIAVERFHGCDVDLMGIRCRHLQRWHHSARASQSGHPARPLHGAGNPSGLAVVRPQVRNGDSGHLLFQFREPS